MAPGNNNKTLAEVGQEEDLCPNPFDTIPYLPLINPRCVKHIEPWMQVAVSKATGDANLYQMTILSLVWNLTKGKTGDKAWATAERQWYAMQLGLHKLDTVSKHVSVLVDAGLIIREYESGWSYNVANGVNVRTPTTKWRLAINHDSPAIAYAFAWQEQKKKEEQERALEKYKGAIAFAEYQASTAELVERTPPQLLNLMLADDGTIDPNAMLATLNMLVDALKKAGGTSALPEDVAVLLGEGAAPEALESPSEPPFEEGGVDAAATSRVSLETQPEAAAEPPAGFTALAELAEANNGNLARAERTVELYRALLGEGFAPDEVYSAFKRRLAMEPADKEKRYYPALPAFLAGERSCSGSKSAHGIIMAMRASVEKKVDPEENRRRVTEQADSLAAREAEINAALEADEQLAALRQQRDEAFDAIGGHLTFAGDAAEMTQHYLSLQGLVEEREAELKAEARRRCEIE